jgi:transposase-like protein
MEENDNTLADGQLVGVEGTATGGGPRAGRAKRRVFTNEYKRRIVAEYQAAPKGSKGAVLRREGLYDSHVLEWKAAIESGTLESGYRRGRPRGGKARSPEQARISELERENTRLRALVEAKEKAIVERDTALDVLGKGVAFLESLSSRNAR